jgi:hypothetical protein
LGCAPSTVFPWMAGRDAGPFTGIPRSFSIPLSILCTPQAQFKSRTGPTCLWQLQLPPPQSLRPQAMA